MIGYDAKQRTLTLSTRSTSYQMKIDGTGVLLHTYSFLYPYTTYGVSGYYLQMGVTDAYYDGWYTGERIHSASLLPRVLASLSWRFGAQGAMQIPVIGWAFNMGLIVWVMLYLALRAAYLGQRAAFGVMLLPVLLWGTFLLGPVMAGRYIYPFVCALPAMASRARPCAQESAPETANASRYQKGE